MIVRLLINVAALWVAVQVVPGLAYSGPWWGLLAIAVIFGVVNTIVRPLVKFFTLPFLLVTLGLFIFVINALMLWLTSYLSQSLGFSLQISSFSAAFLGALVISIVSCALSLFVRKEDKRRDRD